MKNILGVVCLVAGVASAQGTAGARDAYQTRLAAQEVFRLAQQFGQLSEGLESLTARMNRVEGDDKAETGVRDLKAEIEALKADVASLRREQDGLRAQIVDELSKKFAKMVVTAPAPAGNARPAASRPKAPAAPPAIAAGEGFYEHVVEAGQTLSEIARGFDVPISKIVAANPGLKPNALRVGQKIVIPETK